MMQKAVYTKRGVISRRVLLSAVFAGMLGAAACSSPVDQAERYYQSGMTLFEEGDLERAEVQFRNALQLVSDKSEAIYALVLVAERRGNWERVFNLLNRVVEQDPTHLDAKVKLGQLLLAAGELQSALQISAEALELGQDNPGALALRAGVLMQLEDYAGAGDHARAALETEAGHIDALMVLAAINRAQDDADNALRHLDRALEGNERNLPVQLLRLQALERLGDFDAVAESYEYLIDLFPEVVELRAAFANFHAERNDVDAAKVLLREVVRLRPEALEPKVNLARFVNAYEDGTAAVEVYREFLDETPNDHEVRFALVGLHQYLGNDDAAHEQLQEIIALDPEGPYGVRAKGELASAALTAGDRDSAQGYVDQILAADPQNDQGLFLRARIAIDEGRRDEAIADLRTLLRESPDSARGHYLLGRAHELDGARELAEGQYLRAFHTSNFDVEFGLPFADFLQRHGNLARAERILEDVVRYAPRNVRALEALAQLKMSRGDLNGADEIVSRLEALEDGVVSSSLIRAALDVQQRDFDSGIAALQRAYQTAPGESRPVAGLVHTLLEAGRPAEAMRFITSVLEASPDHPTALVLRAQLLELDGGNEQALTAYRQAVDRAATHIPAYVQTARLLSRLGRYGEAVEILDRGIATVARPAALQVMKASVLELDGQIEAAITQYERVLAQDPRSDLAANNLASLLTQYREDTESHRQAFELARRFERSQIPHFIDTWAWANYRMGNYDVAVEALRRVVDQMPEMPLFRYHLGKSFIASGDVDSGRAQLQKAIELAEDAPFAHLQQAEAMLRQL